VTGKVYNVEIGNAIGDLSGHSKEALTCSFKPTRPYRVVTGGEDYQVNFYTGPPFRYSGHSLVHSNFLNGAKYSPDGKYFVTVGGDRKIFIWDGSSFE